MNEAALRRSLEQINEALKEPISAPRHTKVRKVTDKARRLTKAEIDEIVDAGKPREKVRRLTEKEINEIVNLPNAPRKVRKLKKRFVEEPPRENEKDGLTQALSELAKSPRKPSKRVTTLSKATSTNSLTDPFPDVPAGRSRRGAITTQKIMTAEEIGAAVARKRKERNTVKATSTVTINDFAEETGMQHQLVRLHLRKAGIEKPGSRWQWERGSRAWARARKALKLPAEKP